jgi:hypothetical protein
MTEDVAGGTSAAAALTKIIEVLQPLSPEEQHRTMNAAMLFLGIAAVPAHRARDAASSGNPPSDDEADDHHLGEAAYPTQIKKWMRQNSVTSDELDRAFQFHADGAFDIHDVPGKSKKEQTLNTYIMTGLGRYLATGERRFDDAAARQTCEDVGCYDQANHAQTLKTKGAEFSGDKARGYTLSNVGIKRGAALVKELAAGASS